MSSIPATIHVVVFPEGDYLIAQCLEYDIAAQGKTIEKLEQAFMHQFVGQMEVDLQHGVVPLKHFGPAPAEFWEMAV